MIRKTILVFAVLFAVYTVILMLNPKFSVGQHQWQDNVIKGEKYIYNKTDSNYNVITGSSLACRIRTNKLTNFYNLSFAGQSVFDGLEIIKNSKILPKTIFIETNIIFVAPNKEFTSSLFSPLSLIAKQYCISLRSDKQPLAFIFPEVQRILKGGGSANTAEINATATDTKLFTKMLSMQISNYSKIPDSVLANRQLNLLIDYVNYFKSKDVKIVFFEMPLNPVLVELPLAKFIRNKFNEHFPTSQYSYIKLPDCSKYVTTDGLHLNDQEALIYTAYFKEELKKINTQ